MKYTKPYARPILYTIKSASSIWRNITTRILKPLPEVDDGLESLNFLFGIVDDLRSYIDETSWTK